MKNITSLLFLILLSTSTANAESATHVSRVDLFATCVDFTNESGKKWRSELFTAAQLEELDPYQLKTITLECGCQVEEAFKILSQDTIQALNTSLKSGVGDIIPSKTKASLEFQKSGMADKQTACNVKADKTSGMQQKVDEVLKVKPKK